MLRSIGEGLAQDGHNVHAFASRPSYRGVQSAPRTETLGALQVKRCWVFAENRKNPVLRFLNVLLYCCALFFHVFKTRPDVVSASTFPPVIAAWSASLAARFVGAKFIYHMQDIHPEVSQHSGGKLGRGIAFKILRWLDNQTLRRSDTVIVLSSDMLQTVSERGIADLNIKIINNFLLDDFDAPLTPPDALLKPVGVRRAIFAGNLGRFQNLDLLAEGVATCFKDHPNLELMFLGDGALSDRLKEKWSDHPQVKFAPFLPFAQAQAVIAQSDIGLVSLTAGIYRVAYPSKVLSYLGLGVPVLALVEPESGLAHTIEENGLGVVPEAPTAAVIGATLDAFLNQSIDRESVQRWYADNATQSRAIAQWQSILK